MTPRSAVEVFLSLCYDVADGKADLLSAFTRR